MKMKLAMWNDHLEVAYVRKTISRKSLVLKIIMKLAFKVAEYPFFK